MSVDREAAERAIQAFLQALGHDPQANPELRETPARVAEAYADELLAGYGVDIGTLIRTGSLAIGGAVPPGPVAVHGLAVATVCPHHLTPALGRAVVGYLPGTRMLGLGTLARLVDACARRLVTQEQIGQHVVEALMTHGEARGAVCELSLRHACLCARGARQARATVRTVATAGQLGEASQAAEVDRLLRR
jgi:GTP cyclohydrolase I